jgi:hypothetical protein
MHPARGRGQQHPVVGQSDDFDRSVIGHPINGDVPRLANALFRDNEATAKRERG